MKHFILIAILLGFTFNYCLSQYNEIPQTQVPTKLKELKEGKLKDSVLLSTVGFFVKNNYNFTKITDYKILVNTTGYYFKMDLANDADAIVAGFVFFIPHNRVSAAQLQDSTFKWVPNEHLCICSAKTGEATIKMSTDGFKCAGIREEWNNPENLSIDCHDTELRSVFFSKYYAVGAEKQSTLKTVSPQFIE